MRRIIKLYCCSIFVLIAQLANAQNLPDQTDYQIRKTTDNITIDGRLDEETWKSIDKGSGFYQTYPTDNSPARDETEFMITYDENFLYVAVICTDALPGKPITNTLKRDFDWINNDNISFYIDPYNDKSNGFTFQVTADNVQREGLVILGGDVQSDWDNKWFSEVYRGDGFWSTEMAIPFKSFRYNSIPTWNIQFIRNNQKRNERTTWIQVPQQMRPSDMIYSGRANWDKEPSATTTNISFIPYVSANSSRDYESNKSGESSMDAGFDAKIAISSSMNLDLTFNPDFSQVEVDQQVTNLQRFEISFPEKRQFFLENQDLFAENGFRITRPFFSRRIGIQGSGSSQRNVPIIGGARLSGKLGNKWRVGVLNMITDEDEIKATDDIDGNIAAAQNYSVATLERQILNKRSRVSAVFVGRSNLGQSAVTYDEKVLENDGILQDLRGNTLKPRDTLFTLSDYNYVYGLDYNLTSENNKWEGSFYYHRSTDPDRQKDNFSQGGYLGYRSPTFNFRSFYVTIGEGYNAEVGFVPRTGITRYGSSVEYNFYTPGAIQRHGPEFNFRGVNDRSWSNLDNEISGEYSLQFLNTSQINLGAEWQSILLQDSFDPSRTDGVELNAGTEHSYSGGYISYNSDGRKQFSFELFAAQGSYYNGSRWATGGSLNYRYQPILQLGIEVEYNNIELPEPYNDAELLLISPRIDVTWTNKLFFTSFLQYNSQDNNFSQNHRFQWRFKPVSDLFIVYTDNYLTTPNFDLRNRALVLKLSYWLNV